MVKNSIKVAIAGVGNIASGLIQGIEYLKKNPEDKENLLHPIIGTYEVDQIEIVAAFDVDSTKVGKDLSEAIFVPINCTPKFVEVDTIGVLVEKGPVADGITGTLEEVIEVAEGEEVNVVERLKDTKADIFICALPTGAEKAVNIYAQAALDAEVAFVNCTPTFIASDPDWAKKFRRAYVPLVGDDLQSLSGGTVLHKGILEILKDQGVKIKDTYQLDVSGGLETLNTLDDDRKAYKRKVKEKTIQHAIPNSINIASGTSDYLDFLGNRRIGHFWIYGETFMRTPIKIDIRLETLDGPNGAATLIDVIRAVKLAINRAKGGPLTSICAFGFKAPPVYSERLKAHKWFNEFIDGVRSD
ncbi:MAG: inositol-3-phosphate synthase [Candidatus Heimdallarchaeaceae archaeon]